jgi:hypothetical protein
VDELLERPRLSIGRRLVVVLGAPTGIALLEIALDDSGLLGNELVGVEGIGGLAAYESVGRAAPTPLTGCMPPVLGLANPVKLESAAVTGIPGAEAVAVALEGAGADAVLLGANVGGGLFRMLLSRQQSQPARAIPAHTRPIRPTTGFLPIGIPFPVRDETRRASPCATVRWVQAPGSSRPLSSTERAGM